MNMFPKIRGTRGVMDDSYIDQSKSMVNQSNTTRRGRSMRPMMQVKNGKLLLVK